MSYNLRPRTISASFRNDEEVEEVLDGDNSESGDNVSEDLEESDEYEVECESSDTDEIDDGVWLGKLIVRSASVRFQRSRSAQKKTQGEEWLYLGYENATALVR